MYFYFFHRWHLAPVPATRLHVCRSQLPRVQRENGNSNFILKSIFDSRNTPPDRWYQQWTGKRVIHEWRHATPPLSYITQIGHFVTCHPVVWYNLLTLILKAIVTLFFGVFNKQPTGAGEHNRESICLLIRGRLSSKNEQKGRLLRPWQ